MNNSLIPQRELDMKKQQRFFVPLDSPEPEGSSAPMALQLLLSLSPEVVNLKFINWGDVKSCHLRTNWRQETFAGCIYSAGYNHNNPKLSDYDIYSQSFLRI